MSVGLLLKYPGTQKEPRLVPISTEEAFGTYWLPASKLLGLQWVPLFQGGVAVSKADIPDVLCELEVLKKSMAIAPPPQLPAGVANHMVERIEQLIAELQALKDEQDVEAYIG